MKNAMSMQENVFWYAKRPNKYAALEGYHTADAVVVGGGMAGLTATQQLQALGLKVILVERSFCGSGASGRSSGFITPNAELGLTHFVDVYGKQRAHDVWKLVERGVHHIQHSIKKYGISCDYVEEDTLVLANSNHATKALKTEHDHFTQLGFESSYFDQGTVAHHIGSDSYYGGMRFGPTFGINVYAYLQELKTILNDFDNCRIYEDSPVISIEKNEIKTPHATIKADKIFVCLDRYAPYIDIAKDNIYQAETFILVSDPLQDRALEQLFPQKRYMMWDTDLVYQYFRVTPDNRFMIGGASVLRTFHVHSSYVPGTVRNKLNAYVQKRFPYLNCSFRYMWPGFIGVTQDIKAIAGVDPHNPTMYLVAGATGLPWAATLGHYVVESAYHNRNDFDDIFSPSRYFLFKGWMQKMVGKSNAFALSNFISLMK